MFIGGLNWDTTDRKYLAPKENWLFAPKSYENFISVQPNITITQGPPARALNGSNLSSFYRIAERLLLPVRRGYRVYCDARWSHRTLPWVWLSDVQGS